MQSLMIYLFTLHCYSSLTSTELEKTKVNNCLDNMEGSDIWIFCIFQGVMFLLWSDPPYENTRSLAATFFYSINWWS